MAAVRHDRTLRLRLLLRRLLTLCLLLLMMSRLLELLHRVRPLSAALVHRGNGFCRGHAGAQVKQMVRAPRWRLHAP